MSTCPDCEFCPYFDLAREKFNPVPFIEKSIDFELT